MNKLFGTVYVGNEFGADGLYFDGCPIDRHEASALRDHLSVVLGDAPAQPAATASAISPAMSPADALKLAEETVTRIAPATNSRGYTDGAAPLAQRTEAIVRFAEFLMRGGTQ